MKMSVLDRGQRFWFSTSLAVKLGCDAWKKDLPISQLFIGDIRQEAMAERSRRRSVAQIVVGFSADDVAR